MGVGISGRQVLAINLDEPAGPLKARLAVMHQGVPVHATKFLVFFSRHPRASPFQQLNYKTYHIGGVITGQLQILLLYVCVEVASWSYVQYAVEKRRNMVYCKPTEQITVVEKLHLFKIFH